ncbi:MAG: sugar transferase [Deltaproteobacteria bacterium]|nr:sugar transferase [Deltaproteobacteria bacterium]
MATFRYLLFLIDIFLVLPAFYLTYYLRTVLLSDLRWFSKEVAPFSDYVSLILYLIIFTPLILNLTGAYQPFRRESLAKISKRLLFSVIIVMFFSGAIIFFRQEWIYSRSLLLGWGSVYFILIFFQRILVISFLRSIRKGGFNYRRIAIVGTGAEALEVITEIQAHSFWGLKIEGLITKTDEKSKEFFGLKVLGNLHNIDQILREHAIDEVYCTEFPSRKSLEKLRMACIVIGCPLYIVPERKKGFNCKISVEKLGPIPLVSYRTASLARRQRFIKRALDLFIVSLVMLVFPLIYLIVGIAIKLDSPGPVLYSSIRIAHNRRRFRCHKFRTMTKDAENLVHLLKKIDEIDGPARKSSKDPRITRVGRFLRKYSIDEIPQFINVFKGEMCLVGPRPPLPDEVEKYGFSDLRRLSMPQGITGLWQVSGRDAVKSFRERLKLDLAYIDNWSLWLDFKIILKTFPVIFKGSV